MRDCTVCRLKTTNFELSNSCGIILVKVGTSINYVDVGTLLCYVLEYR